MAVKSHLFDLIKSLNKAEKAYFKKNFHKYKSSKPSSHLELFDAIDGLPEYDEERLLKKLKGKITKSKLAGSKNYLYKQLCNSMSQFEQISNDEAELYNQLTLCQFLLKKGLFEQTVNLAVKALGKVRELEMFELNLRFQNILDEAYHQSNQIEKLGVFLEDNFNEVFDTCKRIENYWSLRKLCVQHYHIHYSELVRKSEEKEAALEKIANDPLIMSAENSLSFKARSMVLYILIHHYRFRDIKLSLKYRREHLKLIEDNPLWITHSEVTYLRVVNNLLVGLTDNSLWGEAKEVLEKYKSHEVRHPNNKALQRSQSLVFEIGITNASKDENYIEDLIRLKAELEIYEKNFTVIAKIVNHHQLAVGFIATAQFDHALDHINWLMDRKEENLIDVLAYSRILNLIVQIELNNIEYAQSAARNTYRYLKNRKLLYESDKAILQFVRSLEKVRDKEERMLELKKLHEKLKGLQHEIQHGAPLFSYFDIMGWLRSQLENKPMLQIQLEEAAASS